jgi:hypothetical protein
MNRSSVGAPRDYGPAGRRSGTTRPDLGRLDRWAIPPSLAGDPRRRRRPDLLGARWRLDDVRRCAEGSRTTPTLQFGELSSKDRYADVIDGINKT